MNLGNVESSFQLGDNTLRWTNPVHTTPDLLNTGNLRVEPHGWMIVGKPPLKVLLRYALKRIFG